MTILGRLALLFVIVPLVELVLLIELGRLIGLLPTVALVVFTGVTGAFLARAEGVRVFFQFQRELASGRLPGQSMLDGISVLVGGAFLLTPGVLTDVLGFSLLLPFTRRWIQRRVRERLERQIREGSIRVVTMSSFGQGGDPFSAGVDRPGTWEEGGDPPAGRRIDPSRGMDPSKGIVIEPDDD